ncbi:MAG: hypothetical protein WDO73_23860 [Ignavibacteriota bacterium]
MSVFQGLVEGNGTKPFRLAFSPTLMLAQDGLWGRRLVICRDRSVRRRHDQAGGCRARIGDRSSGPIEEYLAGRRRVGVDADNRVGASSFRRRSHPPPSGCRGSRRRRRIPADSTLDGDLDVDHIDDTITIQVDELRWQAEAVTDDGLNVGGIGMAVMTYIAWAPCLPVRSGCNGCEQERR